MSNVQDDLETRRCRLRRGESDNDIKPGDLVCTDVPLPSYPYAASIYHVDVSEPHGGFERIGFMGALNASERFAGERTTCCRRGGIPRAKPPMKDRARSFLRRLSRALRGILCCCPTDRREQCPTDRREQFNASMHRYELGFSH